MRGASNAWTLVALALTGCARAAAEREPVSVTVMVSPLASADQAREPEPESEPEVVFPEAKRPAAITSEPMPKTPLELAKEAHRAGATAYARGDYDKAREHWETALEYDPRAIPVLYNITQAALKQGDDAGACHAVQRAERAGANPQHTAPLRAKLGSSCP